MPQPPIQAQEVPGVPEVPTVPNGYRLLNICPRLFIHDDLEGSHLVLPQVECSVSMASEILLLGANAERMRQPLEDDRFYAPAQSNGQLGFFAAVPEDVVEIPFQITWQITVPGHTAMEACHTIVARLAPGPAEPVFYQDRDRLPGPMLYSTGNAGFLRQDRTTSLLVPTTVLRSGDLAWRDEAIVSETPGRIELFDDVILKPIDTRDFITWTSPELAPQPHEHQTYPRLDDPVARATHYSNALTLAGVDGFRALLEAVRLACESPWKPRGAETVSSLHPAVERLCAWWNPLRPSGTSPAESISVWVRLDDAGGYWDAAGRAPNMELEVSPEDRNSAVAFGDAILVFFCLSKANSVVEASSSDTGITQYLANGKPFWTIPDNGSTFESDEDAVLGLARLPELLAEGWAAIQSISP